MGFVVLLKTLVVLMVQCQKITKTTTALSLLNLKTLKLGMTIHIVFKADLLMELLVLKTGT
tara:strand:- start:523 stop:705 length:183 start_codon:yes stop_codon:yes gene_type:complete